MCSVECVCMSSLELEIEDVVNGIGVPLLC